MIAYRTSQPDRVALRFGALVLVWGLVGTVLRPMPIHGASPFATRVIEYTPAPGQFVQSAVFNNPAAALGAPTGGGTAQVDNSSVVTLGGFGGCLVLAFDHTVMDEPLNPMGLDGIVFGNAFWGGGNLTRHWGECGVIEISYDDNGNSVADDDWFLIPGSHMPYSLGINIAEVTWDSNIINPLYPPASESWVPLGRSGIWHSAAFPLPVAVFGALILENPPDLLDAEAIFGYADYSPTLVLGDMDGDNVVDDVAMRPDVFYTVPDDPWVTGISAGSGGGDAFDIGWAVDPDTGEPARLTGFDFIRICNGVHAIFPLFGEKSPEIDAVSDVAPDPRGDVDEDGDIDLLDLSLAAGCLGEDKLPMFCAGLDGNGVEWTSRENLVAVMLRMTGPLDPIGSEP